tara:strand:+ start:73 stop:1374 length:1302 start_codon:yes stop_codon:yes gene_type:complete
MQTENKNISYQKKCKICGNINLKKVLFINEQYISATFVKSNKNNDLTKIKTPLTLVLCAENEKKDNCGLLQLLEITKADLLYRQYFYRSATSDTMRKDLKDVVENVKKIVNLQNDDTVVDIGANDCTLLNYYSNNLQLVGFEPAQNIKHIDEKKNIKIFPTYFNAKDFKNSYKNKAKIITSCAMFYDLEEPKKFVRDIDDILDKDGVWCVQISYLSSMLKYKNFYDICHEHLSYYSIETFEAVLRNFNLKLFFAETNHVNGGSIRLFVCRKDCDIYNIEKYSTLLNKLRLEEKNYNLKDENTYKDFQNKINDIKNKTNLFVDNIIKSKKEVFALGASTKGNILLQHFGLEKSKIPYISERNPEKVGLRCLGSDIELISEESARSKNPKAFVVLPWNFKEEIVKREKKYLDDGGTLMFPMPYPHTVDRNGEKKL